MSKATAPAEDITDSDTESVAETVSFSDALSDARAQQDRIVQLTRTRGQDLPTSGTVLFVGSAWANIVTTSDNFSVFETVSLVGDASLDVDFLNQNVKGDVIIVAGELEVARLSPTQTDPTNYDVETVAISAEGKIELGSREFEVTDFDEPGFVTLNYLDADYLGDIETSVGEIAMDGVLEGQFYGNRVNNPDTDLPFKGLFVRTQSDDSTRNGVETWTSMQIGADSVIP